MTPQELVTLALKVSIVLIVFGYGLQATTDDLIYLLRRPGVLLRSLAAMFVVMPAFAILLTTEFHFHRPIMIALIALAISPVPPALLRKVHKAGGAASYELGLMVTAASLSILYIPLAVKLIGYYFHLPFAMRPAEVAKLIGLSVLLPLAAGVVFERVAPAVAARIAKPAQILANVLLILGVAATLILRFQRPCPSSATARYGPSSPSSWSAWLPATFSADPELTSGLRLLSQRHAAIQGSRSRSPP